MQDQDLLRQLASLLDGVPYKTANLANAASLLFHALEDVNWVGFYLLEGDTLVLGPFMGKPACVAIGLGRGVCGTAAKEDRTVLVPDVHAFPGHIACDSDSNAELVIPLHNNGVVCGVLDIDSPTRGRFTQEDKALLEQAARIVETALTQGKE